MSKSRWVKCVAASGTIRGLAVDATDLLGELSSRHSLTPAGTRGMGEALIGALMLASGCKPGERINLNVQGSGKYKQALVDAHPDGRVRGYVMERSVPLEVTEATESLGPWGGGLLSVLKTKDQAGERPYIGTVPLLTGHLAKDLTFYWFQSEQIPSAVGISIDVDDSGAPSRAVGFLIQALPGADSETIRRLESHLSNSADRDEIFHQASDPVTMLSVLFPEEGFSLLEERALRFECRCSRDRVTRALVLLGQEELRQIVTTTGNAEVRCDFCATEYVIEKAEIEEMIRGLKDA